MDCLCAGYCSGVNFYSQLLSAWELILLICALFITFFNLLKLFLLKTWYYFETNIVYDRLFFSALQNTLNNNSKKYYYSNNVDSGKWKKCEFLYAGLIGKIINIWIDYENVWWGLIWRKKLGISFRIFQVFCKASCKAVSYTHLTLPTKA